MTGGGERSSRDRWREEVVGVGAGADSGDGGMEGGGGWKGVREGLEGR